MDLSYKQKAGKTFVFGIIILFTALIQSTEGLTIEIFGARCFPLIPVCIILGMEEDERFASLLALFAGFLWDVHSSAHMGFNAVYLALTCFVVSALVIYIIRSTFITAMIFSSAAVLLYCLLYWLFFIIFKGVSGAELSLFSFYLPSAVYTIAATPVIYFSLKPLKKAINRPSRASGLL